MEITENETTLNVKFPSERRYLITIDNREKTFYIETQNPFSNILDVKSLREYSSEIAQIATLIKDQLNMVHGYEFNEDVEKPEPDSEATEFELQKKERIKKRYFKFFELPGIDEHKSNELKEWWDYQQAKRFPCPTSLQEAIKYGIDHKSKFMSRPTYWFNDIIKDEKEYSITNA